MQRARAHGVRWQGVLAVTALVSTMVGCGTEQPTDEVTSAPTSLSSAEVDRLTGPDPGVSFDDEQVERAWQQKWGVGDIGDVSRAIKDAADKRPAADGGLTYDAATLTFTQWFVDDATDADQARAEVQDAFDTVAKDSNLRLRFTTAAKSIDGVQRIGSNLAAASRRDPAWPDGLAMTGSPDPATGTYLIEAGDQADDPEVVAYFDRHWPGQVTLSDTEPATQENSS